MLLALQDLVHLEMVSQPKRFLELECIKSNHGKDVQLICSHKSSCSRFTKFREKGRKSYFSTAGAPSRSAAGSCIWDLHFSLSKNSSNSICLMLVLQGIILL
ncbi:unnamed protein product, partial [Vitis vinifera]